MYWIEQNCDGNHGLRWRRKVLFEMERFYIEFIHGISRFEKRRRFLWRYFTDGRQRNQMPQTCSRSLFSSLQVIERKIQFTHNIFTKNFDKFLLLKFKLLHENFVKMPMDFQFFLNVTKSNEVVSLLHMDKISVLKSIWFHPLWTNILKHLLTILQTNHQKALINPESCHLPSWSPTWRHQKHIGIHVPWRS